MASPEESSTEDSYKLWQQGDYALGVGPLVFAEPTVNPAAEDAYDLTPYDHKVVGMVLVSQTCDIVNGNDFVVVCPLVECDQQDLTEIRRGTKPSFAELQLSPAPQMRADLSKLMTISKSLLRTWDRCPGFNDESERDRFGYALERKFGRFAFPNEIVAALAGLRSRILEKYKKDSEAGKVYRSVVEIRVRAAPSWDAKERLMGLVVVIEDLPDRECSFETIEREIRAECDKIKWPKGTSWDPEWPRFRIGTTRDLTMRDHDESKALDLHYLS
jgi:hypothetical protein